MLTQGKLKQLSASLFKQLIAVLLLAVLSACDNSGAPVDTTTDGSTDELPAGGIDPTVTDPTVTVINFVSASESQLVLSGISGADQSTLTFSLRGITSSPVVGETVTFSLSNTAGGISLSSTTAVSDATGNVSVVLSSGASPTIVKVTAAVGAITVDSTDINISTGAPVPSGFSLSSTSFNPKAFNTDGTQVQITAFASDQAGNPAADGTIVSFRTEGGQIESSCVLASGSCTVNWASANPRPLNGITNIFASVLGAEDFFDSNGNFLFDSGELAALAYLEPYTDDNPANGSYDLGETFSDWNGNGLRDSADLGEPFSDYDGDGVFTPGVDPFVDFNNSGSFDLAGDGEWTSQVAIGQSLTIAMSGNTANVTQLSAPGSAEGAADADTIGAAGTLTYSVDDTDTITLTLSDQNGNSLPEGTSLGWDSDAGTLANQLPATLGSNNPNATGIQATFNIGSVALTGFLRLEVRVPNVTAQNFFWTVVVTP